MIRPQCVVVVVNHLNVLTTYREYGNRKAKYPIGPGNGHTLHPSNFGPMCKWRVHEWSRLGAEPWRGALVLSVGATDPRHGKKGEKLCVWTLGVLTCVCLGLPYKVKKFDLNRPFLTGHWDCLTLLPHRVRSGTWWWYILMNNER